MPLGRIYLFLVLVVGILTCEGSTVPQCPINMEYTTCSCQGTCEDPHNENGCNNNCTKEESCMCSDGFLMKGGNCVNKEDCGCFLAEEGVLKDGVRHINSDCSRSCSCRQNHLTCENIQCSANATCLLVKSEYRCECNDGFVGDGQDCSVAATDCLDLYNSGVNTNGVYTIHPIGWSKSGFSVRCDMESNDGGWTVFQRRLNGTEDFYRNWTSYKEGFGMLTHEFWLGNDKIHTLTKQKTYQLNIEVVASNGESVQSIFSFFKISDESAKYQLFLGTESGDTVGNPLQHNKRQLFSTYDQDNDNAVEYNCAEKHHGAWWYNDRKDPYEERYYFCWKWRIQNTTRYCGDSNLNGDQHENGTRSIFLWYSAGDPSRPECGIIRTEMKIRPA